MQKGLLVVCLIVVIASIGTLVKQREQIKLLQTDGEALRKEIELSQASAAPSGAPAAVSEAEREELVRLRGEVASLRRQLSEAAKARHTNANAPAPSTAAPATPEPATPQNWDLRTMSAQVQTSLGLGQTLVTGGWASQPGKKTFVFLTPELNIGEGEVPQFHVKSTIVEAPEAVLKPYGLDRLQAQGDKSTLNQILQGNDSVDMLKSLQEQPDVNILSAPQVVTANGRPAQISVGQSEVHPGSGQTVTLGPFISVLPRLSPDQDRVTLDVQANINLKGPPAQQP